MKWGLWVGWTIVCLLGFLMGFRLTASVVIMLDLAAIVPRLTIPVAAGALIGLAQWIVVKRYVTASPARFVAGGTA